MFNSSNSHGLTAQRTQRTKRPGTSADWLWFTLCVTNIWITSPFTLLNKRGDTGLQYFLMFDSFNSHGLTAQRTQGTKRLQLKGPETSSSAKLWFMQLLAWFQHALVKILFSVIFSSGLFWEGVTKGSDYVYISLASRFLHKKKAF